MTESLRRTALVTGASAGIGASFARVLAAHDFDLVLTARREDRLRALAGEITDRHGVAVRVVAADLAEPGAPARLQAEIDQAGLAVDLLVNNAGFGLPGKYAETTWADQAAFIQLMVTSYAELVHRFLPGMVARRYGRIVNVASVAGLVPGTPGHTLYAASKAFLIKFSQALALENRSKNVHVTALCPGFTRTEFHDANHTREVMDRMPKWVWLDADRVAREGYDGVMAGRPVVVNGALYKSLVFLARHLPQGLVFRANLRQSRRYRKP